jgi:tetratricopeptide (TPR) repeat protein
MVKFLALALALCAPAAARAEWHEASSLHFVVYSDDKEETVRAFAEKLERFDKALRVFHGIADEDLGPANRVTVYVVGDMDDVQRLGGYSPWSGVAGFYRGSAGRSVALTPRTMNSGTAIGELGSLGVLLHEYTHHFMLQNFPAAYPIWYEEGFAEFNSAVRFEDNGAIGFGAPANHRAWDLYKVRPLPIEQLFEPVPDKLDALQWEATVYARGWLLTHYLTFSKERAGQLGAYLAAINGGKSSLDAAKSAFGDLAALDKELKLYLDAETFAYLPIPPEKLVIQPVQVRALRPGEAAIMPLLMRSRLGPLKESGSVATRMRLAAKPFPDDPAVQVALAEAEYDADHLDAADAAADRALAADPRLVEALIYKARIRIARAKAAPASFDAAAWKETRRLIGAANRADPNNPRPMILFYNSFKAQGIPANANAVEGLAQAFALAPQDRSLRLTISHQYLIDGHAREARAALAPIAVEPHVGKAGKAIAALIVLLDKGDVKGALDGWEAATDPDAAKGKAKAKPAKD